MIFRTNAFGWCVGLVVVSSIGGAAGGSAAAQQITITPEVGTYIGFRSASRVPLLGDCFRPDDPYCLYPPERRTGILASPALGLIVSTVSSGVGIELALHAVQLRVREAWRWAYLDTTWAGGRTGSSFATTAAMRFATALPMGGQTDLLVGAGVMLVLLPRELIGFDPRANRALPGVSLSTKVRFRALQRTRMEIGIAHSLYGFDLGTGEQVRHDVMLSAGISTGQGAVK
jgi:hypothetical protein